MHKNFPATFTEGGCKIQKSWDGASGMMRGNVLYRYYHCTLRNEVCFLSHKSNCLVKGYIFLEPSRSGTKVETAPFMTQTDFHKSCGVLFLEPILLEKGIFPSSYWIMSIGSRRQLTHQRFNLLFRSLFLSTHITFVLYLEPQRRSHEVWPRPATNATRCLNEKREDVSNTALS